MKVKVSRSEYIDSCDTELEIADCTAVEAISVINSLFFSDIDEEIESAPMELLH